MSKVASHPHDFSREISRTLGGDDGWFSPARLMACAQPRCVETDVVVPVKRKKTSTK